MVLGTERARRALAAVVALGLAAFVAGWHAEVIFGGATWSAPQYRLAVAPARAEVAAAVRSGRLPTWWDEGFGAPLSLAPAHAAWYPGTYVARGARGADMLVLVHLLVWMSAVLAWARHTSRGAPGAWCAAAAMTIVGVAVAGVWPEQVAAATWATVAVVIAARAASPRAVVALAVALGLGALAGSPAVALVGSVACAAAAVLAGARRWRHVAWAVPAAVALSAAAWLPAVLGGGGLGPWRGGAALVVLAAVASALGAVTAKLGSARARAAVAGVALASSVAGALAARAPLAPRAAESPAGALAVPPRDAPAIEPRRVYCPVPVPSGPPGRARSTALVDPGAPLATATARAAGWTCVPGRSAPLSEPERALWQRGAGAGGRLLRRWSVGHAVVPSSTVVAAGFEELARAGAWSLVAVPARPIAAAYPAWRTMTEPAAATGAVLDDAVAALDVLVVEAAAAVAAASPPASAAPEPCAVTRWSPGEVALQCAAAAPAMAALAVAWHPGWHVWVDGVAARPLRAEGALVAVALAPGRHEVRWRFAPRGATAAAMVSLLAALAFAGAAAWLAVIARRRRSSKERA